MTERTYGEDVAFLSKHVETIELTNDEGARIVVVPQYQGRTMTSTAGGNDGTSYGWINYDCVASDDVSPKINLCGGEDRMWISPEGGQFSVFFDPDVPMDFANWRTPKIIDTEAFDLVEKTDTSVSFEKTGRLVNMSRFEFDLKFERKVRLLKRSEIETAHDVSLEGLSLVAHESLNTVTNVGDSKWEEATGLLGVWMLCMNKPSPNATIVIPYQPGDEAKLGKIVNADYFGKLENDRLQVDTDTNLIYFRGDGEMRSKLGLTFSRVKPTMGSWDPQRGVFSVVDFNLPKTADAGYTNNLWEYQDEPFAGDVINSYNDGPTETGERLGAAGFYELETISPALPLAPSESFTHQHRTVRMEGDRDKLSAIAKHFFGVSLDEIEARFGG